MKTNIIKGLGATLAIAALSLIFTSGSFNGPSRNLASDSIVDNLPINKLLNSYKLQLKEKEAEKESIGPTIENEKKLLAERAKKQDKKVLTYDFTKSPIERILEANIKTDETKKESIGPTIENEKKLLAEKAKKEAKVAKDPAKKEETIESLKIKIADLEKKIEADKKAKDEAKDKEVTELKKEVASLRETNKGHKAKQTKAVDLIAQLRALFGDNKAPVAAAPVAPDNSALTAVLACMQETQKTLITMVQGFSTQQHQQVNQMGNPFDVMDKTFSMMQKYGIGQGFSSYNNQQPMGQNMYTPSFGGNQMIAPVYNYPRNMVNTVIGNTGYDFQNNNRQVQPGTRPM